jgi:hypothetical protein
MGQLRRSTPPAVTDHQTDPNAPDHKPRSVAKGKGGRLRGGAASTPPRPPGRRTVAASAQRPRH